MEYDAKYVKCPYYIANNSKHQMCTHQIRCEGVNAVGTVCLLFKSREGQLDHKKAFCYSIKGYHRCPVAQVLDERWADK